MMPNVSSNNDLSSSWLTNSGTTLAIGFDRKIVVNASVVDLYRRPLKTIERKEWQ